MSPEKNKPCYQLDDRAFLSWSNGFWMAQTKTNFISGAREAWRSPKSEYKHHLTGFLVNSDDVLHKTEAFFFVRKCWRGNGHIRRCYDFISSTCDPWQRRFLSAPFYAHPITCFYTINYIPLLPLSFWFPHHLAWFLEWAGTLTDQPSDALCTISSPLLPRFPGAKPTRRAAELIVFYNSCVTQPGVRDAFQGERSRLQRCTSASEFVPSI